MTAIAAQPADRTARNTLRRRRILYAVFIVIVLTGLYFAMGAALAWEFIRPTHNAPAATPAQYSIAYSDISFVSHDGVKLSGWYVPANHPRGVIVLCHGIDANRGAMLGNAHILNRAGFATVLFDFRARGESGGRMCTLGVREPEDIQAAVRWIHQKKELRGVPIGVLGVSLGGASLIMATARTPEIKAIVVESPFSQLDRAVDCHFRELAGGAGPFFSFPTRLAGEIALGRPGSSVSPVRGIMHIAPRPMLIIADADDKLFPARETDALYRAAKEPKELWTVQGAGHCGAGYIEPQEYARRITKFFTEALGSRQSAIVKYRP